MPKGSPDLKASRRDEIITACEKLYRTKSFKEITMKDIGNATSFTRTSIYNYFRTKEEIFLALLKREYEIWIASLKKIMAENNAMTKNEFADMLARSLEERARLLKIMSMNHYDMEAGSSPEQLAEFKIAYGEAIRTVTEGLNKYFPDMTASEKHDFIYTFFPFMFGVYPYTFVTEKQKAAMAKAGVSYVYMTIYEITYNCVRNLLKA